MRKKTKRLLILVTSAVLIALFTTFFLWNRRPRAHLSFKDLEIYERYEFIPEQSFYDLIDESKSYYKDLTILVDVGSNKEYESLETYSKKLSTELGIEYKDDMVPMYKDMNLIYMMIGNDDASVEIPVEIKTQDTTAPKIFYTYNKTEHEEATEIVISEGSTLKDNLAVSAKDYYFGDYVQEISVTASEAYTDILDIGEHDVNFIAVDEGSNEASLNLKISVKKKVNKAETFSEVVDIPTTSLVPESMLNDERILVNRKNSLPKNFEPVLATIPEKYAVSSGYRATANTVNAFEKLADTMVKETGLRIFVTSSYRSYDYQSQLYNGYVAKHGQKEADRFSAKPGHSEHQTGLALDLIAEGGTMMTFGETPQSKWVSQNAHRFGFIIRYLEGKEDITGYMAEPWHLRYIGMETATKIYNLGLSYEEYLELE